MSLAIEPKSHQCNILEELKDEPLSPKCLSHLFLLLEPHIYPPTSFEQCLRRNGHTENCIKDLTQESKDRLIQKEQTAYLVSLFAKKWSKPLITGIFEKIPPDLEICRFLINIPNKKRDSKKPDFTNDCTLFQACLNSKDSPTIEDVFERVLKTKDPQLIVAALTILKKTTEITRKALFEKVKRAVIHTCIDSRIESTKDTAVSRSLVEYLSHFVPEKYKKAWASFRDILEENYRVSDQLRHEIIFSSYSSSKHEVVEPEMALYEHLEELFKSDDPVSTWEEISEEIKKEYAYAFACLLTRLESLETNKEKPYTTIIKNFTDTTVKTLDQNTRGAVKMMLQSYKLLDVVARSKND